MEVPVDKKSLAQIIFDRIDAIEAFDEAASGAVEKEGNETDGVVFRFADGSALSFSERSIAVVE